MKPGILVVSLAFLTFANTDSTVYKNSIGWDGGLSYRRILAHNWWIGAAVTGRASETAQDQWARTETRESEPESTILEFDERSDSMLVAQIGVRAILGREIVHTKWVTLSIFARPGYMYQWHKKASIEDEGLYKSTAHKAECSAGLEPSVLLFERISLGTRFGLLYQYMFGNSASNGSFITESYTRLSESENERKQHSLSIIGVPFSLTMTLVAHFHF